jgi:hypothetical protein
VVGPSPNKPKGSGSNLAIWGENGEKVTNVKVFVRLAHKLDDDELNNLIYGLMPLLTQISLIKLLLCNSSSLVSYSTLTYWAQS